MSDEIQLRDYQNASVDELRAGTRDGFKNQVLCAPTGSGKTILGAYLLQCSYKKGNPALFVVERNTLIDQTSAVLDRYGIPHGVVQANHWRRKPGEIIQICSAQTLNQRGWPKASLIVVDECHIGMQVIKDRLALRNCAGIGLTATPFAVGMGLLYERMVQVTTANKLTAEGHLVPFRAFAAAAPDMTGVKVVKGEWKESESTERCAEIIGDVVREYVEKTPGQKAIAFGVSVDHCQSMRAQFQSAGIRAELHTYDVPEDVRKLNMAEFRKPDSTIKVLLSVSALSRGLDVPDCSVVIMAKPIRKSLSEFIQILGRVLRSYEGKHSATVLDLAGNMERFWAEMQSFFEHGAPPLDKGEKSNSDDKKNDTAERPPKKCPSCSHVFQGGPVCPACGYVFPVKSHVEHVAGVLMEFNGGQQISLSPEARKQLLGELRSLQIEGSGFGGSRKPAWIGMQFKAIAGYWPSVDFLSIEPLAPSRETRQTVRLLFQKWRIDSTRNAQLSAR